MKHDLLGDVTVIAPIAANPVVSCPLGATRSIPSLFDMETPKGYAIVATPDRDCVHRGTMPLRPHRSIIIASKLIERNACQRAALAGDTQHCPYLSAAEGDTSIVLRLNELTPSANPLGNWPDQGIHPSATRQSD